MRYTAIILLVAAGGVLALCASLFDGSTLIVVALSLGIVGLFGTLPVLFGVITRRRAAAESEHAAQEDDAEVVRFDSESR